MFNALIFAAWVRFLNCARMYIMLRDLEFSATRRSTATLIAWVSVCLLVAGWGPRIQPQIRELWARIGALGLVASVAFDLTSRAGLALRARRQRTAAERRIEKSLNQVATQHGSLREFGIALHQISQNNKQPERRSEERRQEPRLPFMHPVRVQSLVAGQSTPRPMLSDAPEAYVEDISPNGIGLVHNQPLDSRHVILTFELMRGGIVSLMVELQRQHFQTDGKYHSGGRLIKVMSQDAAETTAVLTGAG